MNDHIDLDSRKYRTPHGAWAASEQRPLIIKRLMSGASNVTFGPATFTSWRGAISVDVTPLTGFGTLEDFRATYRKLEVLTLVDHYGDTYSVVMDRTIDERSLSPMWTADDNVFNFNVTLIKV